jgi:hypothetical protein
MHKRLCLLLAATAACAEGPATKQHARTAVELALVHDAAYDDEKRKLGIPDYMLTMDEARAVAPLVLPFDPGKGKSVPAVAAGGPALAAFVTDYLADVMRLKAHAPGRRFKVTIVDNPAVNAFAKDERVTVNSGILREASPLALAMVLCHEMAHAAQNHSRLTEATQAKHDASHAAEKAALDAALAQLIADSFDQKRSVFTVRQARWQPVKPLWDAYWGDLERFDLAVEATADALGGRLCADAGFSAEEVVKGFGEVFALIDAAGGEEAPEIADGEQPVPPGGLAAFLAQLFGQRTHPSVAERAAQLQRLQPFFAASGDRAVADRWLRGLTPAVKAADFGALSLTERPAPGAAACRQGLDMTERYVESLRGQR